MLTRLTKTVQVTNQELARFVRIVRVKNKHFSACFKTVVTHPVGKRKTKRLSPHKAVFISLYSLCNVYNDIACREDTCVPDRQRGVKTYFMLSTRSQSKLGYYTTRLKQTCSRRSHATFAKY